MAHVVVSNIVSLEGFYEGPTDGVMELPTPGIQHQPAVAVDDPRSQMLDEDNRAISRRYDDVDVLVVSDTLSLAEDSPWRDHTRVVPRATVAEALAAIGGKCVVFGSHTTWNGLLRQGLVDELHVMVGACVLFGGTDNT